MPRPDRRSGFDVLRAPAFIAAGTVVGLAAGLLGGPGLDLLAWSGLALPVIAGLAKGR